MKELLLEIAHRGMEVNIQKGPRWNTLLISVGYIGGFKINTIVNEEPEISSTELGNVIHNLFKLLNEKLK